jgi:hypothetical protein
MMFNKLMIFALAMSLISGCQNTKIMDPPRNKEIKLDADVINIHGNVKNRYKMDDFLKKVNQNQNASIRISHYTIEGDPIYNNIKFEGGKFELQYDTTQDQFGAKKVITYSCETFDKNETNTEMKYTLHACSGEAKDIEVLHLSYDVSKQDYFGFHLKYGEKQTNEINTIDMSLVKDLQDGQMQAVSDFQLSKEEQQNIYKKMVLSNYLGEKQFSTCTQKPTYYLKVKINGGMREFNWTDCDREDNKAMTELANFIIETVKVDETFKSVQG